MVGFFSSGLARVFLISGESTVRYVRQNRLKTKDHYICPKISIISVTFSIKCLPCRCHSPPELSKAPISSLLDLKDYQQSFFVECLSLQGYTSPATSEEPAFRIYLV